MKYRKCATATALLTVLALCLPAKMTGAAAAPLPRWVNISPPQVSLDANQPPSNFGFQNIAVDPIFTETVYVGTCYQGLWKSKNGGQTWFKVNTGVNGDQLNARLWSIALDRFSPQTIYVANGYGGSQGVWKSTDGGVDWQQMLAPTSPVAQQTGGDVSEIATDPYRSGHVLVAFHGPWGGGASGILESRDGGSTWIIHQPLSGWGGDNRWIAFLGNSATWLLGTQNAGFWRTADAGKTWTKVTDVVRQDGGGGIYRARNGVWYVAALQTLLRSTDDGRSWSRVGPQVNGGYYAVIGDGNLIYTHAANTGASATGPTHY